MSGEDYAEPVGEDQLRAAALLEGLRRWPTGRGRLGCPCGCTSKPPWVDDPDCVRHRNDRALLRQLLREQRERGAA